MGKTQAKGLLSVEHPQIFSKIKRPVNPVINPATLTSGSGEKMVWECYCGLEFIRPIQVVVHKSRITCRLCMVSGKSRLEFEVAELLSVMLNTTVVKHYGATRKDEVDLYVPSMDLAIQLDPFYTHQNKTEIDVKVLNRMKVTYSSVLRVREDGLDVTADSVFIPVRQSSLTWASLICDYLQLDYSTHTIEVLNLAISQANESWDKLFSEPLMENIGNSMYGVELVENVTHRGRKIEYTPQKCSDLCLWKCTYCSKTWEARISARKNGLGCPKCSLKKGGEKAAKARQGESIQENSLVLSQAFTENLTHPERGINALKVTSGDKCVWTCENGHVTIKNVDSKYAYPDCRICLNEESALSKASKVKPPKLKIYEVYPFLVEEFSSQINGIKLDSLNGNDNVVYSWDCATCSVSFNSSLRNRGKMLKDRVLKGKPLICVHANNDVPDASNVKVRKNILKCFPILEGEFLKNVSSPGLTPKAVDVCQWKCHMCGNVWDSTLKNRCSPHGCQVCALKTSALGRMTPHAGSELQIKFPVVATSFVENITHPERGVEGLSFNSRDVCVWLCDKCDRKFTAVVYSMTQNFKPQATSCWHKASTIVS